MYMKTILKVKIENKNKMKTMKTKIISTTMILLFAVATIAGASNIKTKNSSAASCHENAMEQEGQEMISDNVQNETSILNEWITTRETWEQESLQIINEITLQESFMLNEWIATREIWEQESQEMVSDNALDGISMLNVWIANRENWEQE
jgi:hypothetical protein